MEKFKLFENLSDRSSIEEIKKGIESLGEFKIPKYTIPIKTYFFRSRLGQKIFIAKYENEVSINPNTDKISKGRANPQGYPVFYGCTNGDTSTQTQWETLNLALVEGSSIYRRKGKEEMMEQGCVTRWSLTQEVELGGFMNFDFGGGQNLFSKSLKERFKLELDKISNKPDEDWHINNLVAEKFAQIYQSEEGEKYNITSAFSEHILNSGYDGIAYPSVLGKGSGINVALSFDATKFLKLEYCALVKNFMENGEFSSIVLKETTDIKNGMIKNYKFFMKA